MSGASRNAIKLQRKGIFSEMFMLVRTTILYAIKCPTEKDKGWVGCLLDVRGEYRCEVIMRGAVFIITSAEDQSGRNSRPRYNKVSPISFTILFADLQHSNRILDLEI